MDRNTGSGLSFAKRIYLPRAIGLGIGFFCVAAGLWPLAMPGWIWALLLFNGFLWPHVAFQVARLAKQPYQCERRNLLLDSVFGGFWAGAMQFNALPTVTILAMMAMNNIAAGGARFFLAGSLAQLGGALLAMLLFGFSFNPATSMLQLYACLPMLVLYPLALGLVCYQLTIRLAEHKQALRAVSRTDSLTRLFNHGYWKDLLHREFSKCRHGEQRSTVALIDVDHFKEINDSHGHLVGDSVLRLLSERLVLSLREEDLAGRYGGDEFCVILPHTPPVLACEVMERLRVELAEIRTELAPQLRISLSIGLAGYSPFQLDATHWLKDADQALYLAKSGGRNRVVLSSEAAGHAQTPALDGEQMAGDY
ncbi:diguanylate cyclase AdrA [Pseudomonas alcaligenes]|uniref:diguanylate cyclase n=1 Tax=Aquipseudomonas alcaligenes TaxID=43263 RepID=A0ABR7RY48_AQUAC|nr:diguanylate cyclase [Pseudomonas alcaligenes]MBC9250272.1 diguanylate cyclase AdrA [Pseudomonas alcaligenes]